MMTIAIRFGIIHLVGRFSRWFFFLFHFLLVNWNLCVDFSFYLLFIFPRFFCCFSSHFDSFCMELHLSGSHEESEKTKCHAYSLPMHTKRTISTLYILFSMQSGNLNIDFEYRHRMTFCFVWWTFIMNIESMPIYYLFVCLFDVAYGIIESEISYFISKMQANASQPIIRAMLI